MLICYRILGVRHSAYLEQVPRMTDELIFDNSFHVTVATSSLAIFVERDTVSGQQAATMYYFIFNVFIILLSSSSFAYSQTPLQAAISQLNPCANNCIARAARFIKCASTDFACLCAHPDAVIGPDRQFSFQGGCLFHDCGPPNVPDVKSNFKKICALNAASSAVASILPAATPLTVVPTTISSFPSNSPPPATVVPLTTSVNDAPPPPAPSSTEVQIPVSTIPVTQNLLTNSPAPLPVTSISETTPPPAQVSQAVSNTTFLTPSPETTDLPSTPFYLSLDSTTVLASLTSPPTNLATSNTNSNPSLQTTTSLPSPDSKKLPADAVVWIMLLVLGFVATILSLVFIQLRRRKRKSYIADRRLEDKLHQQLTKDENSPSTQGGGVFSSTPEDAVARWSPWDLKKSKNLTPSPTSSHSPTSPNFSRPKPNGLPNERPPPFPLLLQTNIAQGVNTSSPTSSTGSGSGRPGTSGSSISSSGQPLKSAMEKSRGTPKSRPLILFNFGLDPLGSNPNKTS